MMWRGREEKKEGERKIKRVEANERKGDEAESDASGRLKIWVRHAVFLEELAYCKHGISYTCLM